MAKITYEEREQIIGALQAHPRIRFQRIGEKFGRHYNTIAGIARAHGMVQWGRS